MTCDLLPGPRLGHAFNSWGRSAILSASRLPSSLSSSDSSQQLTLLSPEGKLSWKIVRRYRGRVYSQLRPDLGGNSTGIVSNFIKLFLSGKWLGISRIQTLLTLMHCGVCHPSRHHFVFLSYIRECSLVFVSFFLS